MTKVTPIGAGRTIFAKNLIGDLLSYPELADVTLCLFDIDAKRLGLSERVAHRIAAKVGARPEVIATTARLRALEGADYAVNMIQVGGYRRARGAYRRGRRNAGAGAPPGSRLSAHITVDQNNKPSRSLVERQGGALELGETQCTAATGSR